MKKINKFKYENEWDTWVGSVVTKHSKKPFKSGLLTGTVNGVTINPYSQKKAFKMDDGSIVDCYQVTLVINEIKLLSYYDGISCSKETLKNLENESKNKIKIKKGQ